MQKEENSLCRGPVAVSGRGCEQHVCASHVAKEPCPPCRAQPRPGARRTRLPTFREDPVFACSEGGREVCWRVGVPGVTVQPRDPTACPGGRPKAGVQPGPAGPAGTRWDSGKEGVLSFLLIFDEGIGFVIKTAKLSQALWQTSQSKLCSICFDDFMMPPLPRLPGETQKSSSLC